MTAIPICVAIYYLAIHSALAGNVKALVFGVIDSARHVVVSGVALVRGLQHFFALHYLDGVSASGRVQFSVIVCQPTLAILPVMFEVFKAKVVVIFGVPPKVEVHKL